MKPGLIVTYPPEIGDTEVFMVERMERDFWSIGSPPTSQTAKIITPLIMKRILVILKEIKGNCERWNGLIEQKLEARRNMRPDLIDLINQKLAEIFCAQVHLFKETHGFSRAHIMKDLIYMPESEGDQDNELDEGACLSNEDRESMVHLLKEVDQLEPDERPAKRQKISRNIQKAHDISMLFDKEVRKLLLCPKEEAANKFWDANSEIMNANKINREDYKRGSMTNHPGGKLNTIVTMNWNLLFVTDGKYKFEDCEQVPPGLRLTEVMSSVNLFPHAVTLEKYKELCLDYLEAEKKVMHISGRALQRETEKRELIKAHGLSVAKPEKVDSLFNAPKERNHGVELTLPLYAIRILMMRSLSTKPQSTINEEFELLDDDKDAKKAMGPLVLDKIEVIELADYLKPIGVLSTKELFVKVDDSEAIEKMKTTGNRIHDPFYDLFVE